MLHLNEPKLGAFVRKIEFIRRLFKSEIELLNIKEGPCPFKFDPVVDNLLIKGELS